MEQEAEWARRSPAPIRRAASGRPPRWSISQPIWLSSVTASSSSISIPKATRRADSGSIAQPSTGPIYDALVDGAPLADLHVPTPVEGVRLVPSSIALAGAEVELAGVDGRERRLARALDAERDAWDWILIDCPPSLGILTVNALTGADTVLVPIQCEFYALEGLTQLIATINLVRDHLNPDLAITGVVLTMFDGRTNLSTEVAAEVRRHLHEAVFQTVVPRSVRLSEAPSHGLPIALYRPESKGAEAYRALALEVRGRRAVAASRDAAGTGWPTSPSRPGREPAVGRPARRPSSRGSAHDAEDGSQRARARTRPVVAHPAAAGRIGIDRRGAAGADLPQPLPAPPPDRRRRPRGARGEHPGARRAPARARHRDARRLPARRRRATRARGAPRRPRTDPRARSPARRSRAARGRARRERAARRPRSDRRGARLPPADRGVRADPGTRRGTRGQGPGDGREHAPTARPPSRRPGGDRRRPADRGPRPRARRTAGGRPGRTSSAR